jgi:hypothetical protein
MVLDMTVRHDCRTRKSNTTVGNGSCCLEMFQDYFTPLVRISPHFTPLKTPNLELVLCKFSKYFQNIQKQIWTFMAQWGEMG